MSSAASVYEAERQQLLDPCSRAISWSKNGFICHAAPAASGHNLKMTFLENYNGSNWQLAAPNKLAVKPSETSAIPSLQWISWSNLSTDLAVFDEHGNFYILLAGVGLLRGKKAAQSEPKKASNGANGSNGPPGTKADVNGGVTQDGESDGPSYELTSYNHAEMIYRDLVTNATIASVHSRCVAFEWLGIDKPQIISQPARAAQDGQSYSYGAQQLQASFLAHPISTKQACVAVRQNGTLCLYHQGEHKVEYHKLSVNLAPNGAENSMYLTHAAIGFTRDKKILVTVHDAVSGRILSYSVSVNWGYLVESAARQKSNPHYCTPQDAQTPPTLHVELFHEMAPLPNGSAEIASDVGASNTVETYRLSSIDIVPPYYAQDPALDILISYELVRDEHTVSYTVLRYRLEDVQATLIGPFSTSNTDVSGSKNGPLTLVFQGRINIGNRLKAVRSSLSDSIVLFIHWNGSIMALNRQNWTETAKTSVKIEQKNLEPVSSKPEVINSVLDSGYTFPQLELDGSDFLFAVSPHMTCIAYLPLGSDESLKLSVMRKEKSPDLNVICSTFAHVHAHACYSNTCSDDVMALFEIEYNSLSDDASRNRLIEGTIFESHSAINFHFSSFVKESVDKLLSNPPLQKLLSLQLVMSELGQRKIAADIAWVVLNLRSTSFGIMFSLSSIYRQISKKKPVEDNLEDSSARAECIISLVGSVKWLIDVILYLNQELLQLAFSRQNPDNSRVTMYNSLAIPIILSKVPRLFLMYALSSIGRTHEILKKLHRDLSESNKLFTPMKEALERFFNTCNTSTLKLNSFETFLRDCDGYITKEFAEKVPEPANLLHLERKLFCSGSIPQEFLPLATNIVDKHISVFSRDLGLFELYFYDTLWLDIGVASRNQSLSKAIRKLPEPTNVRLQYSQNEAIDSLRKIFISCKSPLSSGGVTPMGQYYNSTYKIRKCVRCRSVSLISDPLVYDNHAHVGLWTMVFQRSCICGSAWVNCI